MGSSASTKRTVKTNSPSTNEATNGGPARGLGKPVTKDNSAVGQDETDAGPTGGGQSKPVTKATSAVGENETDATPTGGQGKPVTKATSAVGQDVTNAGPVGGVQSKPVTKATSAVGQDVTNAGPAGGVQSKPVTKATSALGQDVTNAGPAGGVRSKHVTKATSAVGQDETDAGPAKQSSIVSSNPKSKRASDTQNAEIAKENKTDDPSTTSSSDVQLVMKAAKVKRIEDYSDEIKGHLDMMKYVIDHVLNCPKFPCSVCLNVQEINKVSRKKVIDRGDAADALAVHTDYCKMFSYTWKRRDILQEVEEAESNDELFPETSQIFIFYISLLGSAWNFTDNSDAFCVQMDQDECLSLIVDWFIYHHESEKQPINKWVDDMSFDAINILHNACRRVPSLSPNHHRVVPVLQKFGKSEETLTQTIAFITLAKLVRKEEADKLSTNYTCIVSLLSLLKKCLSDSKHHTTTRRKTCNQNTLTVVSFPAVELVQAVEELAINDKNKKLIAEKGGIPILGRFLKSGCSKEEKTFAANALWRLAFLKENKEQLRKEKGILLSLTENSQSGDDKLRNACMGALFEIYESRLPERLTGKKAGNGPPQRAPSNSVKSSGHIMLSYKWEHPSKPVMREFKKQLRDRGYNVWMDEDHMMGDKIGAMADAVENADMIIACITRGYQDSQDCRTEASYAYECKKKIIPIKVDEFKATGWLGGITAGKIYYMVQGADHVSNVLPSIIEKEFAVQREKAQNVNAAPGPPPPEPEPEPAKVESQVPGWDCKTVNDWLAANNITTSNKGLNSLKGNHLLQLKKQLTTAPQAFYQSMKEDMKVPYIEVLSLASALENLK